MDAAVFGLIVADLIAEPMDLRRPPVPGGLVFCNSIQVTTGGNVCNVGLAMARLGMRVAAAGMVGDDVLGTAVIDKLQRGGIDTSAVDRTPLAQTAATVVAVEPGGERCFFHTPAANNLLDAAAFRKALPVLRQCKWVQIGYLGLLPKLTADLPACIESLRRENPSVRVAFDTVNPPGDHAALRPILPHLDCFVPSRSEAAALTGTNDPREMIRVFRRDMPRGIIGIKLDAEGCLLDDGAGTHHVAACRVQVVDTTGAGDSWYGGLLTGLTRGMSLAEAGRFANRVAADCCTALGASTGIRSFDDTMSRL